MTPTNESHPLIVCAVSRSYSSRYSQERAIALAKERAGRLAFVNVVDPEAFEPLDGVSVETLMDELRHVCASLLSIAVERAAAQGLEATMTVLEGQVTAALETYLRESGASTLVIGASGNVPGESVFSDETLMQFVEQVRADLDVESIVVDEHRR